MIQDTALDTDNPIDVDALNIESSKDFNIYQDIIEDNVNSTESIFLPNDEIFSIFDNIRNNDTSNIIVFYKKDRTKHTFDYIPSVAFNHILTQKWINANRIKSQILNYQEIGDVERTLDFIFDTFDDLLIENKFDLVNSFFEIIDVKDLEINSLIGILTITSPWKDNLQLRSSFYQEVSDFINSSYLSDEAKQILGGLE